MKSFGLLAKIAALTSFVLLIASFVFYKAGGFDALYSEDNDETVDSAAVQPPHKEEVWQETASPLVVEAQPVEPATTDTTPAIKNTAPKVRKAMRKPTLPNSDSALADAQDASIDSGFYRAWFGNFDTTDTAGLLAREARKREIEMMASSKVAVFTLKDIVVDTKQFFKKKKKAKKKSKQPTTKK